MKINVMKCLLIILLCAQLLIITCLAIENKLSVSSNGNLDDHGATTVVQIKPREEDGSKAIQDHEVNNMIATSKKSQGGKKGSGGGGTSVVRDPSVKKKNGAVAMLPQTVFSHLSVISFILFIALSF